VTEIEKLKDAPLERVPQQEIEVIFLFSHLFKKYGFTKLKKIESKGFPDCIASRKTKSGLKDVRIEFEYQSINFPQHLHNSRKCDCIVCWEHNWYDIPKRLEVIELRQHYGFSPRIWVMAVGKEYKEELSENDKTPWTVPSKSHAGDLALFYYTAPESCIKDLFEIKGQLYKAPAGNWTVKEDDVFAEIKRISPISSPLFFEEMKNDKILTTSRMVKMRMQGKFDATPYWHRLYDIIIKKNPGLKSKLKRFSPEKIY